MDEGTILTQEQAEDTEATENVVSDQEEDVQTEEKSEENTPGEYSEFTLPEGLEPDPDLLEVHYVEAGQTFRYNAFSIDGQSIIFPANTFNNGGIPSTVTLVFDQMKETVEGLKKANLRNGLKLMIGGCQMDENTVKYVGADGYRPDAVSGVRLAKEWVGGV